MPKRHAVPLTRPRRADLHAAGVDGLLDALCVGVGDVVLVRPSAPMRSGDARKLLGLIDDWLDERGLTDVFVVLAPEGVTLAKLLQSDLRHLAAARVPERVAKLEGRLRRFRDVVQGFEAAQEAGDHVSPVALRQALRALAAAVDEVYPREEAA